MAKRPRDLQYANDETPPPLSTLAKPDIEAARLVIESVLAERRKVWEVSKENGPVLKDGLVRLRFDLPEALDTQLHAAAVKGDHLGVEDVAAKYEERMAADRDAYEERAEQSDAEWYGMAEDEYVRMMATEVADASDADFAAIEAAIPEFNGVPPSTMTTRAAMEALGFTEQEIQDEENRAAAKAGAAGGSYVPKGMVDYSGILSLLAPKTSTRASLLVRSPFHTLFLRGWY